MKKPVRVEPEAGDEIAAGLDWYERQRPGLGREFLDEINESLLALAEPGPECAPLHGVPPELDVRRKLVRRFPFMIVFIELERSVRVIAVAHGARRPGYWRHRI